MDRKAPFWKDFLKHSDWPKGINPCSSSDWTPVEWSGKRYPRFERFKVENCEEITSVSDSTTGSPRRYSCRDYCPDSTVSISNWWHVARSVMLHENEEYAFMPVGSAGGIWGTEVYFWSERVEGLPSGLYHVLPRDREVEYLWELPPNAMNRAFPNQGWVGACQFIAVITAFVEPYVHQYGNRGLRFAIMECGAIYQEMLRAASEVGLGHCILGGFSDRFMQELLDIREHREEKVLCAVSFGTPRSD